MNAGWQRRLHLGARALGWMAGVALIALAVLMALAQLLQPLVLRHPGWVARELSATLQRPVSFARLDGHWTAGGPLFDLRDVVVGVPPGEAGVPIRLPRAQIWLDVGGGWLPARHLLNLRASGLQLDLVHGKDGRWRVDGIGSGGATQQADFGRLSVALQLDDLRLAIRDEASGQRYALVAEPLRLSRQGKQIRVGLRLRREGAAGVLQGAGRFRDDGSAGRLWLAGQRLDLGPLMANLDLGGRVVQAGQGDVAAWLDWQGGQVQRSFLRIDLRDVRVATAAGARVEAPSLKGEAELTRSADGYVLRWAGADTGALALWLHHPGTPQFSVQAAARGLQVAPLLPWLGLLPKLPPALANWLGAGHPRGQLDQVSLAWSQAGGLARLDAGFSGLGIDPAGSIPGVSGLAGTLRGDAEAVSLSLAGQAATVDARPTFRTPFVLSRLAGTLALWHADGDWHLGIDPLDFEGQGYGGQARGEIRLHDAGGAPFLDLYASIDHGEVPAAKLFWPVSVMPPGTVQWLDRALVAGTLDHGEALVRGDLKDWPFRHNEGRFEARAQVSGLRLRYAPDWPEATGIHAVASFIDNGMLVEADGGDSLGVKADKVVALIPDFGGGLLDLNVDGHGHAANLLGFVAQSPIARAQADVLARLKLGGSGSFGFHLALPLGAPAQFRLAGHAQLKNVDVSQADWSLRLDRLSGPASFDGGGFHAGPLEGSFHGQNALLDLAIADATGDPATALAAHLTGAFRLDELTQGYPALDWLNPLSSGRSLFDLGFRLARPAGGGDLTQTLSVDSSLLGMTLTAPVPLRKAAATALPLHLTLGLPLAGGDLKVALGEVARGHLRLANGKQPLAGTLAFGAQMPAELPAQGLRIRGHAATLDVTGWVQQAVALSAGGGSAGGGPLLESVDVGTDHAEWFGRPLGAMTLRAVPKPDALQVDVDGPLLAGHFSVPGRELDKRGITAQLTRLYWPGTPPAPAGQADGQAGDHPAATGINPAALPPFHLWVGDLRFGDARLGEARLETWPTDQGMHIDQLRALSPSVQLTGSGDWNGSAADSRTTMRVRFAADDLGKMLNAFGYNGLVSGGKTDDELDASWPGAPSSFSLANATGTLAVHVDDGRIPEVGPGMGRLFGLVSLTELPRRLTLDFGDVFGKGLGFDSIKGHFRLADGNATTSDLVIKGPAAQISITGRTGLRAKDYDQEVIVVPHVGNSLPVIGAVVGGPVGAAAGLAVQGILGKGLNRTAGNRYHVTGSWDKPVMTLVEKHAVPPPAVQPPLLPGQPRSPAVTTPLHDAEPATASSAGQ